MAYWFQFISFMQFLFWITLLYKNICVNYNHKIRSAIVKGETNEYLQKISQCIPSIFYMYYNSVHLILSKINGIHDTTCILTGNVSLKKILFKGKLAPYHEINYKEHFSSVVIQLCLTLQPHGPQHTRLLYH